VLLPEPGEAFPKPGVLLPEPEELFKRPRELFQRPRELFQRPEELFPRPGELFQRPGESFQRPRERFFSARRRLFGSGRKHSPPHDLPMIAAERRTIAAERPPDQNTPRTTHLCPPLCASAPLRELRLEEGLTQRRRDAEGRQQRRRGRGASAFLPLPLGEGRGEGAFLPLPLGEGRGEGVLGSRDGGSSLARRALFPRPPGGLFNHGPGEAGEGAFLPLPLGEGRGEGAFLRSPRPDAVGGHKFGGVAERVGHARRGDRFAACDSFGDLEIAHEELGYVHRCATVRHQSAAEEGQNAPAGKRRTFGEPDAPMRSTLAT